MQPLGLDFFSQRNSLEIHLGRHTKSLFPLLGCMVVARFIFEKQPKCFPEQLHHYTPPPATSKSPGLP